MLHEYHFLHKNTKTITGIPRYRSTQAHIPSSSRFVFWCTIIILSYTRCTFSFFLWLGRGNATLSLTYSKPAKCPGGFYAQMANLCSNERLFKYKWSQKRNIAWASLCALLVLESLIPPMLVRNLQVCFTQVKIVTFPQFISSGHSLIQRRIKLAPNIAFIWILIVWVGQWGPRVKTEHDTNMS